LTTKVIQRCQRASPADLKNRATARSAKPIATLLSRPVEVSIVVLREAEAGVLTLLTFRRVKAELVQRS
jgi:hypothetical protein